MTHKSLGAGTAYLMGSQLMFLLANYLTHIGLARYLGAELYGVFGVLMSLYLVNRAFLNIGVPRAVSKFLAESTNVAVIRKAALRIQLLLSSSFGILYIILAPYLATLLQDESLTYYIMFLGILIIPMSLRSLYANGFLNGLRLFKQQAIVKTVHPFLRVTLLFVFVFMGYELWGVLFAYFVSVVLAVLLGHWFLRNVADGSTESFDTKKMLAFSVPLTVSAIGFTVIKNVNPLFIKSILVDNALVGYYTAAAALANVSFMIFQSLPVALMPSISKAVGKGNVKLIQKYIRQSIRYLLLLIVPITVLIMATASELITLFFSAEYIQGAPVLQILVLSTTLFAVFRTLTSVISGSGKPSIEMGIVVVMLLLTIVMNMFLIPQLGLLGAAWSALIASGIAMVLAAVYVYTQFSTFLSWSSFFRIGVATSVIYFLATIWPAQGLWIFVMYAITLLLYTIVLALLGEITTQDIQIVQKLIPKARR